MLLTTFLIPILIFISIKTAKNIKTCYWLFLVIEVILILTFVSLDMVIFFFVFETTLVLMYFLLYYWGSKLYKIRSGFYLFMFTIFGSILLIIGIIFLLLITGSTNLIVLENFHFSVNQQKLFAFVFTIGFGIKVPIFPFHGWLPDVHSEGSTYGSILLAGILLKLGIYGLLRFGSTILPYGILYLSPLIFLWTLVGCFTCSYNCLRQYDLKKIIAYSSVTHINFAIASLYTLHILGLMGCIITSVNHGVSSSALFMFLGFLYDRTHSRNLFTLQALFHHYPVSSTLFFILILGNLSLPGTLGFYGELFSILSLADVDFLLTALFVWNVCLTTSYSLFLYKRISFGKSFHRKLIIGIRLGKPFYLNPRLLNLLSGKQDRLISYLFWMTSQKILNIEYVSSLKFIW